MHSCVFKSLSIIKRREIREMSMEETRGKESNPFVEVVENSCLWKIMDGGWTLYVIFVGKTKN